MSAAPVSPAVASDFTLSASRTLTIAPGATTSAGTVTITANDNAGQAVDRRVVVTGTTSGGVSGTAVKTLTIVDDEVPVATLRLSPSATIPEGGKATVTAALSKASSATTTLTVWAAPLPPATSTDFALSTTTLTIAPGATTSAGTVTVTAANDDADTPDKIVTLSGVAINAVGVRGPEDVTLTITDDEPPTAIALSAGPTTLREDGGSKTVMVTASVHLGQTFPGDRTVTVSATGSGVVGAADFDPVPDLALTIPAGESLSMASFTLDPIDDSEDETDETITLSGASPGLSVASTTITLTDDDRDTAPRFAAASVAYAFTAGVPGGRWLPAPSGGNGAMTYSPLPRPGKRHGAVTGAGGGHHLGHLHRRHLHHPHPDRHRRRRRLRHHDPHHRRPRTRLRRQSGGGLRHQHPAGGRLRRPAGSQGDPGRLPDPELGNQDRPSPVGPASPPTATPE